LGQGWSFGKKFYGLIAGWEEDGLMNIKIGSGLRLHE
jgi:hypothetical protein